MSSSDYSYRDHSILAHSSLDHKQVHRLVDEQLKTESSRTCFRSRSWMLAQTTIETFSLDFDRQLTELFNSFTSLRELDLELLHLDQRRLKIVDAGLAKLTQLQVLNLSCYFEVAITLAPSPIVTTIASLTALTDLNVSNMNQGHLLPTLLGGENPLPCIRKLNISKNWSMSPAVFSSLCWLIQNRTSLVELDIAHTIPEEGNHGKLAAVLKTNPSLRYLNLTQNINGHVHEFDEFVSAIAVNTVLQTLNLSSSLIPNNKIPMLTAALKQNSSLTNVSLNNCAIKSNQMYHVIDLIECNSTFTSLDLTRNLIRSNHLEKLGHALTINSSLTELSVEFSRLKENDLLIFSGWTDVNTTLTTFNITLIGIHEGVVESLYESALTSTTIDTLKIHAKTVIGSIKDPVLMLQMALLTPTLRSLEIDAQLSLKEKDFEPIFPFFVHNTTLETLRFYGDYTPEQLEILRRSLLSNESITEISLSKNWHEQQQHEWMFKEITQRNKRNSV